MNLHHIDDDSLYQSRLSAARREEIHANLWEPCAPSLFKGHDMSSYFEYYLERCRIFLMEEGTDISLKTHAEIMETAQMILSNSSRKELLLQYPGPGIPAQDPEHVRARINDVELCASLLLMVNVGVHGLSGSSSLTWADHQSLRECVAERFTKEIKEQPDNPRLQKSFTAESLNSVAGIKIKWTWNLADHLRLTDDDRGIFIFRCPAFLSFQQSFAIRIFPPDFLEETFATFALLFPQNDRKSQAWVKVQIIDHGLDKSLTRCRSLRTHERRFRRFAYWHDRLIFAKQAFDDSRPRSLFQWWKDRRNTVQWYGFWVVIVITLVFGVIQSVEGAIQVALAWKTLS